jgi:hypothetical protein
MIEKFPDNWQNIIQIGFVVLCSKYVWGRQLILLFRAGIPKLLKFW